jgi:hypothetical protein
MFRRIPWLYAFGLLAVGLWPTVGDALIVRMSLSELVGNSDLIVRGEVLKTECRWGTLESDPGSRIIFTDATVAVGELLKGTSDRSELVIATEGGVIGDLGLRVEDMPEFAVGEEVVVFLRPANPAGLRTVTNQFNGKYTIIAGIIPDNGQPAGEFVRSIRQAVHDWEQEEK